MTTEKLTVCDSWKPDFDASMAERFVVWLRNLYHWKTRLAVNHLSKQLRNDPEFRESWKANIAMPIYDATRPKCNCDAEPGERHRERCVVLQEISIPRRFECREMSIEQADYIAERLLKHLFGA